MRSINFERAMQTTVTHTGRICGAAFTGHGIAIGLGVAAPAPLVAIVVAPMAGTLLVNIAAETVHAAVDRPNFARWCVDAIAGRPDRPAVSALVDDVVRKATHLHPFPNTSIGQRWTGAHLLAVAENVALQAAALCVVGALVGCLGISLPLSPLVVCIDMLLGSATLVWGHFAYQTLRDVPEFR